MREDNENDVLDFSRRGLLMGTAMLGAGAALAGGASDSAAQTGNPMVPVPIPTQAPAKEGKAPVNGTELFYWDTGGDGVPIVLAHPASGSALIWSYQQPVFAKAGYRVIGYSRRGYNGSALFDKANAGTGSEDLHALADFLKLGRFHLVASAAGGSIASDYAFSHQDRLLTLTVSSNSLGVRDGTIAATANSIRPKGWDEMPVEFRELGPSYRAANPTGAKLWLELEHKSLVGKDFRQTLKNSITQGRLKELKLPVLLIAGAADLATAPAISRLLMAEIPNSQLVVAPESGHSVYWEEPDVFNKAVLDFVGKHSK